MSEVKRYSYCSYEMDTTENESGEWVKFSDYEKLKAENAELKNTIGHWQIKNDALKWDKVSDTITKLQKKVSILTEALEWIFKKPRDVSVWAVADRALKDAESVK